MKIFYYGNMQTIGKPQTTCTRGEMRKVPDHDVGALFGPQYDTWVWGQLHEVDIHEIPFLKAYEAPEFRLQYIKLVDGTPAYAFSYTSGDFDLYPQIPSGRYTPTPESIANSDKDDHDAFGPGSSDV
jgi:hypothetical protein